MAEPLGGAVVGDREFDRIAGGFGVYVHIPFCAARCDYCAFATWTDRHHLQSAYVDALVTEISNARESETWRAPATVFIGGGTPSLLADGELARILDVVGAGAGAEITVECNPESVTDVLLRGLADAGVNRLSLGVQSIHRHVLDGLGRASHAGSVERALQAIACSGIANFNVDLIYGGAGETSDDWRATLEGVLSFDPRPTHVSAYALTVEAGTPLAKMPERHPDDDEQAARYLLADAMLTEAGYRWYEISNWSLPGQECRHNLSCWIGGEYLGFGCAAHSNVGGARSSNVVAIDRYLDAIVNGRSPRARCERLTSDQQELEGLELLLRTRFGVPASALCRSDELEGLISSVGGRILLTPRGRMLANEVAIRLRSTGAPIAPSAVSDFARP